MSGTQQLASNISFEKRCIILTSYKALSGPPRRPPAGTLKLHLPWIKSQVIDFPTNIFDDKQNSADWEVNFEETPNGAVVPYLTQHHSMFIIHFFYLLRAWGFIQCFMIVITSATMSCPETVKCKFRAPSVVRCEHFQRGMFAIIFFSFSYVWIWKAH